MTAPTENNCVAAICKCGGWVMLAVLGHNESSDRETFKRAGEMASRGFEIRTPLTVTECRQMESCKHRGDCTTDPEKVRVEQLELVEATNG